MIIQGATINGVNSNDGLVTNGLSLFLDSRNPRSWPGSGTTWYDLSGNGKNATFYNNPSKIQNSTGVVGDGTAINGNTLGNNGSNDLYFNGTSASGLYQYAAGPNLGTNITTFTINTWFYFNSIIGNPELPAIFSLGLYTAQSPGATVNGTLMFYSGSGNDNKLYAGFYDVPSGGWHVVPTGYAVSTGTWYNGVMTYDGSYIRYYINNTLISYQAVTSTTMINSYGYRVGRRWDGYDTTDAYIPVAMVYNRSLSASEISQNFNYFRGRYGL